MSDVCLYEGSKSLQRDRRRDVIVKRWELHATPFAANPLSESLAEQFNFKPERFWTRRGAANTIHFYTDMLGMPVTFWVLDRKDTEIR